MEIIELEESVAFKLDDIWAIQKINSPNVVNPKSPIIVPVNVYGILLYGKGQPLVVNFKTPALRDKFYEEILEKLKGGK